jgi:hypothetical protein
MLPERGEKSGEKTVPIGGVHCQWRGREKEGTGSGRGVAGPWARSGHGLEWFPGPSFTFFSSLLLFFFYFLIPFIDFARMFQISSNHFQKFCKNHSKVLNQ